MSKKTSKKVNKKEIIVFTDGSCSGNGKRESYGGIGIHFPNGELKDVSKVFNQGCCTNQRTELYAILTALRYIKQNLGLSNYRVTIKTDSLYSINCVTKWAYGWMKNGWMTKNNTPVANKEFIEIINKYYDKYDITMIHVEGHSSLDNEDADGNNIADELATKATKKSMMENGVVSCPKKVMKIPKTQKTSGRKRTNNTNNTKGKKNTSKGGSKTARTKRPVLKYTAKKTNHRVPEYAPTGANIIVELVKSSK